LLDAMVAKLGGDLVKVHVDDLRDQVYIGSVFVRQSGKVVSVDARPSDAIALALGRGAPIFVAAKVLAAGGIRRRDLVPEGDDSERVRVPPSGPDPMAL
jgi:bifunctional DNase/RNase